MVPVYKVSDIRKKSLPESFWEVLKHFFQKGFQAGVWGGSPNKAARDGSPDKERKRKMKLINIGFGNMVSAGRLITIVSPESAPIKRIIQDARDNGVLIDATYGRRTRAVIVMDSGHVVLSAIQPETVANRFVQNDVADNEDEEEEENV